MQLLKRALCFSEKHTTFDILMMILFKAKERNQKEFEILLEKTGFRIAKVFQVGSENMIEAIAI